MLALGAADNAGEAVAAGRARSVGLAWQDACPCPTRPCPPSPTCRPSESSGTRERPGYDDDPDHGLRDPAAREAWRARLTCGCPAPRNRARPRLRHRLAVAAGAGSRPPGERRRPRPRRWSPRDRRSAPGTTPASPSATPPARRGRRPVDAVADPGTCCGRCPTRSRAAPLGRLLRPGGRLVLIEGRGGRPGAVTSPTPRRPGPCRGRAAPGPRSWSRRWTRSSSGSRCTASAVSRSLWGRDVDDERYAVVATTPGGAAAG